MAKSVRTKSKTAASSKTGRGAKHSDAQLKLATMAAAKVTEAISKSAKATGKAGRKAGMNIHVHVGDVVMMGFDEAVDAEEWGMRETNNEIAGGKPARGRAAAGDPDAQDEKNRKVQRSIRLRKGQLSLEAVENSRPARSTKTAKNPAKKRTAKRRSR
jgi:hypothetical protein